MEYTVEALEQQPSLLATMPPEAQTDALCRAAVQVDGLMLQYVHQQTQDLCQAALMQNGHALQFVKEQTEALCWTALGRDLAAIRHVRQQTAAMAKLVISDRRHIEALDKTVPAVARALIDYDIYYLPLIKEQTSELCLYAVQTSGYALEFVKNQKLEIILAALAQNIFALQYVHWPKHQLQDPMSGQLQTWLEILKRVNMTNVQGVALTLIPLTNAAPLGKQYRDEWQQPAGDGRLMMDLLVELAGELKRLTDDPAIATFRHRVNRQVELALNPALESSYPINMNARTESPL